LVIFYIVRGKIRNRLTVVVARGPGLGFKWSWEWARKMLQGRISNTI